MNQMNITSENNIEILNSIIMMMPYKHEDEEYVRIDISEDFELLEILTMHDDETYTGNYKSQWIYNLDYIIDLARDIHFDNYRIEEWEFNEEEKCIYIRKELLS